MNKYFILLLAFFLLDFSKKKEDKIVWSSDYKLKWKDFKGKPRGNVVVAISSIVISDYYRCHESKIILDVQCEFNKNNSWVREEYANKMILGHEQYHFNIGEVYTRILKERVSQLKLFKSTARVQYDSVYSQLRKDHLDMQNLYDEETNHSIIEEEQKKWEKKIDSMLLAYNKYAGYTRVELKVYEDE